MATELTPQEKIELIQLQLQETLRLDIIEDVIIKQKRALKIYWGTATTGRPHAAYFVPHFNARFQSSELKVVALQIISIRLSHTNRRRRVKIAHFLRAGCRVRILLADVHGFLDNLKAPWELVESRAEYYRFTIRALLKALGVSLDKLEFVLGSNYQYDKSYMSDLLRLSAITTEHDAKKAGAEVVKQVESPLLSGLVYPLMQALDEQHLDVDAQFGGVDQRKIFTFAAEQLPKIGYKERAHLMNPMVPGLAGGKMSASDPDSKIDLLDTPEVVRKKIRKAYAMPKEPNNGLISFIEYVLLPVSALKLDAGKGRFVVQKHEGGELVYDSIEAVKQDYEKDVLTPQLLKSGVTEALNELLAPIQAEYQASEEWQQVALRAYPPPEPPKKKEKKVKDRGTRFPGHNAQKPDVTAQPDGHVEGPDKHKVDVGEASDAVVKMKV